MIILPASGTLAAVASVASKVNCTIFGMKLASGIETYDTLYQGQFAASAATIYTATANGPSFIKTVMITNTDTLTRTFQLFVGGTASANAITPVFSLLPGGCAVYEDGIGWRFFNAAGQLLQGIGVPNMGNMDNWGITGSLADTMDRVYCPEVNTTFGTTGQVYSQLIWLTAGTIVTNISFHSATSAAGTPTHYAFGLYDLSRNLLASSADQLTAAWAANTIKTLAMGTPYVVPTTGLYYVAISVVATTVPTLKGGTARTGGQLAAQAPIISGISSTTYASGTLPATIGAITGGTTSVWACIT